jgi:hypothetical protein
MAAPADLEWAVEMMLVASSSCGIGLFLAKTAAWLLARVTSLAVFACFRGGGAGWGDDAGSGMAGCGGGNGDECGGLEGGDHTAAGYGDLFKTVGSGREVVGVSACPVVAGSAVEESSSALDGVWRLG